MTGRVSSPDAGCCARSSARYLDLPPRELRFTQALHGKPELTGVCSSLRFNLSHSDDLMLLAVTHAREIGVDLEFMREDVPFETLADHYFDPEDAWDLRLLPEPQRAWKFYDLWTSTEARLKAQRPRHRARTPRRWNRIAGRCIKLTPADGYAAALAVEGGDFQLDCWSWQMKADCLATRSSSSRRAAGCGSTGAELWEYRDLLVLLVQRDFISRYKQTILGPLWFILQPLLTTARLRHHLRAHRRAFPPTASRRRSSISAACSAGITSRKTSPPAARPSSTTRTSSERSTFPRLIVPISVVVANLVAFALQLIPFAALLRLLQAHRRSRAGGAAHLGAAARCRCRSSRSRCSASASAC